MLSTLFSIIVFLIVLALLVFVHELGHFLAAKKMGIRVDEFGLGFPPRIFGKKVGETVYSLNAIPFGGFVKIFGENPDEESTVGADSARSLIHKSKPAQAFVLVAGILCNFIFAWLLISLSFFSGVAASSEDYAQYASRIKNEHIVITDISAHSPAQAAGLKAGDTIRSISNGTTLLAEPEMTVPQIQSLVNESKGSALTLTYNRGEETKTTDILPQEGIVEGHFAIGIAMDKGGTLRLPLYLSLWEGARLTVHMTAAIATGLGYFVYSIFKGTADYSSVSGPVGIVGMIGDATRLGFTYLLMFTAAISINLAVINFVPFPALDGGRILFVLIEAIRRKRISAKVANTVNSVGFALLLLLMAVVTFKDVLKLFGK